MGNGRRDDPEFEKWFKSFNHWGMNHWDLVCASYTPGKDEGDVVAEVDGHVMTRFMCHYWINFYTAAYTGWKARGDNT